jgi:hypothetical protein
MIKLKIHSCMSHSFKVDHSSTTRETEFATQLLYQPCMDFDRYCQAVQSHCCVKACVMLCKLIMVAGSAASTVSCYILK